MQNRFNKRILLIGMPDMALVCMAALASEHFNIVAAVPPHKSNNTHKLFSSIAEQLDIPIINYDLSLNEPEFLDNLRALNIDIALVCSYNKLLPTDIISIPRDGIINVHPSLLPNYRGGNPYFHVICNNEKETGVTLHYVDESFDTGDILLQRSVPVSKFETMGTLFNKLNYLAADMLVNFLSDYEKGIIPERHPQPSGNFISAPSIEKNPENLIIDWTKSADYIERFVRALNPFLSAGSKYRGNYLKIHKGYVENIQTGMTPGTIVSADNTLAIACGNGVYHILILQTGSYVIGTASDFIKLTKCKKGEMLECPIN